MSWANISHNLMPHMVIHIISIGKEAEPKKIIISEDSVKKNMSPPFPQALRSKKKSQTKLKFGRC